MAGEVKAAGRGCLMSIFTLLVIGSFLAIIGGILMACYGIYCLFGSCYEPRFHVFQFQPPWLVLALIPILPGLMVFIPSFIALSILQGKTKALITRLNNESKLSFDDQHILGGYASTFMVFDKPHRKLALCSVVNKNWQIYDFSWVRTWQVTWSTREVMKQGLDGSWWPKIETGNFAIKLETADIHSPILNFSMHNEHEANLWFSRLSAILNG